MACCQGDGGPPDRRAWGQPSSWPSSALPLAPGHDLDVAGHVGTAHQQVLPELPGPAHPAGKGQV